MIDEIAQINGFLIYSVNVLYLSLTNMRHLKYSFYNQRCCFKH